MLIAERLEIARTLRRASMIPVDNGIAIRTPICWRWSFKSNVIARLIFWDDLCRLCICFGFEERARVGSNVQLLRLERVDVSLHVFTIRRRAHKDRPSAITRLGKVDVGSNAATVLGLDLLVDTSRVARVAVYDSRDGAQTLQSWNKNHFADVRVVGPLGCYGKFGCLESSS